MAGLQLKIDIIDDVRLNKTLTKMMYAAINLEPVLKEIGDYMVYSTQERILDTKKSPRGRMWKALAQATIDRKGHSDIMIQSGKLYDSIYVEDVSDKEVTITTDVDYAQFMQDGFQSRGRKGRKHKVPARPFMGFSGENSRHISKMLRAHLLNSISGDD